MPIKMLSPMDILLGKVGKNGNPIHPALVHYPLTFALTASVLDITAYLSCPSFAQNHATIFTRLVSLDNAPFLNSVSYFCTVAALLTSIPTLITGVAEGYHLIFSESHGPEEVKPGSLHPTVKMAILHAWLNYGSVAGAIYNWLSRRNVEGHGSSGRNAVVSGVIMAFMGYAAFLGGMLVYTRGAGVQRMGKGLELKQEAEAKAGKDVKGEKKL